MNKLFRISIFAKLLFLIFVSNSYSASTTGAADVYKVTMKKVELCTASTSVTSCENAIVIGKLTKQLIYLLMLVQQQLHMVIQHFYHLV